MSEAPVGARRAASAWRFVGAATAAFGVPSAAIVAGVLAIAPASRGEAAAACVAAATPFVFAAFALLRASRLASARGGV